MICGGLNIVFLFLSFTKIMLANAETIIMKTRLSTSIGIEAVGNYKVIYVYHRAKVEKSYKRELEVKKKI